MLKGRARHGKSILEVEKLWDTRESASLEAKKLTKQVTNGSGIYLASG